MVKKMKKKTKKALEVGGAVAAAAAIATAAGAYALSDKKRRAKAKAWIASAKKEVARKAKIASAIGEKEYTRIVDQVIARAGSLENMTASDAVRMAKELKSEWKRIQREGKKMVVRAKKPARKMKRPSSSRSVSPKKAKKARV